MKTCRLVANPAQSPEYFKLYREHPSSTVVSLSSCQPRKSLSATLWGKKIITTKRSLQLKRAGIRLCHFRNIFFGSYRLLSSCNRGKFSPNKSSASTSCPKSLSVRKYSHLPWRLVRTSVVTIDANTMSGDSGDWGPLSDLA